MTVIPCEQNNELRRLIEEYAERLKTEAHKLGEHGLGEREFYNSGLFRGAIERVRGQFSATMREKRVFVQYILDYMKEKNYIQGWESAGEKNRHDYQVRLDSNRIAIIELKGCLDGNNTNIFERPPHAQEFVIWSLCTNPGSDPKRNAWSGIHSRLSAEIISREQRVDGVIIWDMVCNTIGRPCPKVALEKSKLSTVGPYILPPPCIYVLPATIPSPRNNPHPTSQTLDDVRILKAFHRCFRGRDNEVNYVDFEMSYQDMDTVRKTRVTRDETIQRESNFTAIRRV